MKTMHLLHLGIFFKRRYVCLQTISFRTPQMHVISSFLSQLNCCGIIGPQDWVGILPENLLPGSCCQKEQEYVCKIDDSSMNNDGCKDKLLDYLKSHLTKMAGIAIAVAVIQACIMCIVEKSISKKRSNQYRISIFQFQYSYWPSFSPVTCTLLTEQFVLIRQSAVGTHHHYPHRHLKS